MNNLWIILKKELREVFRDKKSLAMMLIIPIFIPFLVFLMSFLFESQATTDITKYNEIGFAYEVTEIEKTLLESMGINIHEGTQAEMEQAFLANEVYVYVTKNNSEYIMHTKTSDESMYATTFMEQYFEEYKKVLQQNILTNANIDPDSVINVITLKEEVTKEDSYFASYMKNYAFLFIIMAITVSATYPATDATAGEKERGTLETLLTFPIKSRDIILGKFLSVSLSSIITGILSFALAFLSLYFAKDMFTIYANTDLLYNIPALIIGLLIIIIYSLFISGICIAIASKSKTFKEAQSALTPLTFISLFPSMIAFMIGMPMNNILAFVPFLNISMIFTDINNGIFNGIHIALMFISMLIYIVIILYIIIKQYKSEKVLF